MRRVPKLRHLVGRHVLGLDLEAGALLGVRVRVRVWLRVRLRVWLRVRLRVGVGVRVGVRVRA